VSLTDWVLAVERAYVAAATGGVRSARTGGDGTQLSRAKAAAAAVASHYLAVGSPRSFGLIVDDRAQEPDAELVLEAHRTWFSPRDLRCTSEALAAAVGGRVVTVDEALAADIVCVHAAMPIVAGKLRRGTHVNVLGGATIDTELRRLATVTDEPHGLPALAAGLVDGRKLDELTIFIAGDAAIALAAL
jgi:hypothetical protein